MYQNYRKLKAKECVTLNEKRDEAKVSFFLNIKQFSEQDGSEIGSYEEKLNLETLKKERVLQQGRLEDLDELIADIEAKINDSA